MDRLRIVVMVALLALPTSVRGSAVSQRYILLPTDRIPGASGFAQIESSKRGGEAQLRVEVDGMKPAILFGGDFNTYVLWLVPSSGEPQNVAELTLHRTESSSVVTPLWSAFEIMVTAEPHFKVSAPSRFVVLQTKPLVAANVQGLSYNYERETLAGSLAAGGAVDTDVHQAFAAYRLAVRSNAEQLRPNEFLIVRESMERTFRLARAKAPSDEVRASARETVRLSSDLSQRVQNDSRKKATDAASLSQGRSDQ